MHEITLGHILVYFTENVEVLVLTPLRVSLEQERPLRSLQLC